MLGNWLGFGSDGYVRVLSRWTHMIEVDLDLLGAWGFELVRCLEASEFGLGLSWHIDEVLAQCGGDVIAANFPE